MNKHFSTPFRQRSFPAIASEWMDGAFDRSLPIYSKRREIIETIRAQQVVIIAGETGCGKSTQLPLMCLEARGEKTGRIVVAEPRRIAAISLARYVASRFHENRKGYIGYKVRFHENLSPDTRILFATDGIVMAETVGDELLNTYETIIIDEAHERSMPVDFLLGYLRTVLARRPELKLIIASATLDTKLFSRCFKGAPVITVSGRLYTVDVRYAPVIALWQGSALRSYVDGVIHAVQSIVDSGEPGDILAFLPTVDDIHECCTGLRALLKSKACDIFYLYGRMGPQEQGALFAPSSRRRIICATHIAETSVTIPHIRFVVDTGLARCVRFDPGAGITRMPVERISQASADQRAGRCGRVRDGICIRLYSETDYSSMPRYTLPEMRRSNLAGVILRMARLGFKKPQQFPFLQHPSPVALAAGFRQLRFLGALDSRGRLTACGNAMAALPLDPAIARMLLYAQENGAFNELAVIAAALSVGEIKTERTQPVPGKKEGKPGICFHDRRFASDFMELIGVWRMAPREKNGGISRRRLSGFCETNGLDYQRVKEWTNVHRQLTAICRRFGRIEQHTQASYEKVHKSLLSALAGDIAEVNEHGSYRNGRMREIMLSPGSRLFRGRHDWVLLHDIAETKRPYARYAAAIKTRWVRELFPSQCLTTYEEPRFDPVEGTVTCVRQVMFNGLAIIKNQRIAYGSVAPSAAHDIFIRDGLVRQMVDGHYDFLLKNRSVLDMVERMQRKLRTRSLYRGEQALIDFYSERLKGVHGTAQLKALIGRAKSDRFLRVRVEDLLSGPLPEQLCDYPDTVTVADRAVPLSYVFEPGADVDGVTAVVPLTLYASVPLNYWEWLLPVFWRPRIRDIVQQLTGGISCSEAARGVEEAVKSLAPGGGHFIDQARAVVEKVFGLSPACVRRPLQPPPPQAWLRLHVIDENGKTLDAFRPPLQRPSIPAGRIAEMPALWRMWCTQWERDSSFGLEGNPAFQKVSISPPGQLVPVTGVTGLARENNRACMRVFASLGAAYGAHRQGIRLLLEQTLEDTIAWAWRDFIKLHRIPFQLRELMDTTDTNGCLEVLFHEIIIDPGYELPKDSDSFIRLKERALNRIALAGPRAVAMAGAVLPEYEACRRTLKECAPSISSRISGTDPLSELQGQLDAYAAILFRPDGSLDKIDQLPRYLRGFNYRIRMAIDKPLRYAESVKTIRQFWSTAHRFRDQDTSNLPEIARLLDEFEKMIEEYTLSMFTHGQIRLLFPVSEQRLQKPIEALTKEIYAHETSFLFSQAHGQVSAGTVI
jgi:ATP-dependent helicase HrpA